MTSRRNGTRSQRLSLEGGAGHALAGRLELPAGEPRAFAVIAPCFTCLKDSKAIVRISRALADRGVAVLRYDVTGIGESRGDFATTTMTTQVDDLLAAAQYLRVHHRAPVLVMGISLGGAVALVGAGAIPEARAVVSINAPATTAHLHSTLLRLAPDALSAGSQLIDLLGRRVRIGRALIEDLPNHSVVDAASTLELPLLVVHSTHDEIVPTEHGEHLFAAARQPKSFAAVANSDHLMLADPAAATWVGELIATWSDRVLLTNE